MKKHKLSKRLNQMARWIDHDASIADIGTDHGYLPYYLFQQGKIHNAILCDINQGPLENAKSTFRGSEFSPHAEFRLGSGIEPIENSEVDYVIIAGMGGALIKEIMSKNIEKTNSFKGFFLQPQTEQDILRHWLLENQFQIINDFYAFEDRKYYEAFYAVPLGANKEEGHPYLKNDSNFKVFEIVEDLEFGYHVHQDSLKVYESYLEYKRSKYASIQSKIQALDNPKYLACQRKIKQIDMLLKALKDKN